MLKTEADLSRCLLSEDFAEFLGMCKKPGPQKAWVIREYKHITRENPALRIFNKSPFLKCLGFKNATFFQIILTQWHQIRKLFDKTLPISERAEMRKTWEEPCLVTTSQLPNFDRGADKGQDHYATNSQPQTETC